MSSYNIQNQDTIRTFLKNIISNKIYELGSSMLNQLAVIRHSGYSTYKALFIDQIDQGVESIKLKGIKYPISIRKGTNDVNTIIQNLIRGEYGNFKYNINPKHIIDAGGYIGDVSIYYLNRFHNCNIIILEPNEDNYNLAKINLEQYSKRVKLIKAALWSKSEKLSVSGENSASFVSRSNGIKNKSVTESINLNTLLDEYEIDILDILKIDVEGAESEIFSADSLHWIDITKLIIIEFHSKMSRESITKKLIDNNFEIYNYRSLYYCYNKNFFNIQ